MTGKQTFYVIWAFVLLGCSNAQVSETKSTIAKDIQQNPITKEDDEKTAAPPLEVKSKELIPPIRSICADADNNIEDFACFMLDIDGDGDASDRIRLARPAQFTYTHDIPDMGFDGDTTGGKVDLGNNAIVITLSSSTFIQAINANGMTNMVIVNSTNKANFAKMFPDCMLEDRTMPIIAAYNKKEAALVRYEDNEGLTAYRCKALKSSL
jgi:hypothetical protein